MDIKKKISNGLNYRIYQNITGWEYVTTVYKEQLKSAVSSFNDEIYILVIKHDIELDMDEVHYRGYAGDYVQKIKRKEKKYAENNKI